MSVWTGVVTAQYTELRFGALDGGKMVMVELCSVPGVLEACGVPGGEPAMIVVGFGMADS